VVLRRLVTDPVDDHVLTVDSKQRFYRGELRDLILTTDPVCVVPGCDRPAIQADHAIRYADGGPTTTANGLGVCARHNLAHEQPGHRLQLGDPDRAGAAGRDQVFWITLARKIYQLIHPPALGPGATRKPGPDDRRPPQPPIRQ
jgi:hypothetical protein